jgi:hypothetical protein
MVSVDFQVTKMELNSRWLPSCSLGKRHSICLLQALPRIGFQATQDASCSDSHACGEEHSEPSAAGPATADPASSFMAEDDDWVCAICRDVIAAANTAQVKGCEHAYW